MTLTRRLTLLLAIAPLAACSSKPVNTPASDAHSTEATLDDGTTALDSDSAADSASDLPAAVDLSATKFFPPVGNQGVIGACDWFAAVYYQMTYSFNRQLDRAADTTNTFSPKFGYTILNNAGPFPSNIRLPDVYEFTKKHGAATIAQVPYDMANGSNYLPWCTDADIWQQALSYRIEGYDYFEYNATAAASVRSFATFDAYFHEIKRVLSLGEVIVFQSNPELSLITTATISNDPATPDDNNLAGQTAIVHTTPSPDHTMALVGYDDRVWIDLNSDGVVQPNEKGAFKIVDSFGLSVPIHNAGFLWLAYSAVDSAIFGNRFYRMSLRTAYAPRKVARIVLNHPQRDKLQFQFGRSLDTDAGDALPVFDPYGLGFGVGQAGVSLISGGACAFDGGSTSMDGAFAFDLTDIDSASSGGYWYLRIANSSDLPLTIQSFEVRDLVNGTSVSDTQLPVTVGKGNSYRFVAR